MSKYLHFQPGVEEFLKFHELFITWIIEDIQDNVDNFTEEECDLLWEGYKSYFDDWYKENIK